MSLELSGKAIEARLREASRLASELTPQSRLSAKLDMSGCAIDARLRQVSDLLDLCRKLARGTQPG